MEGREGGGSCVVKISGLIIIKDFTPCATVMIKVGTKITGGEGRESIFIMLLSYCLMICLLK